MITLQQILNSQSPLLEGKKVKVVRHKHRRRGRMAFINLMNLILSGLRFLALAKIRIQRICARH